ncbi:MAG: sigma-70 family RNA polymerase sigma factor [Bacteroidales bacterium]|nr:sigma-70 family RNA polymerase sigma factor [Bacteroidales bacterium]MBR0500781.1 sigma-70 family RNA polymerase sigma factor [Bacteroidales bacterium]
MTDREILALYRKGGRHEAFRLLVQNYKERLYWHIRRMVLDHDDADDCLQNTFLKAWRSLDGFRGDAQLYTWLYRIATNETLSFLSRQQTRGEYTGLDAADRLSSDSWFDGNKLQTALYKAIAKLPPKQKAVFNLRYFEEMPYEKIAAVLETSEGALKASYHHAYEKVKAWVKEEMDAE